RPAPAADGGAGGLVDSGDRPGAADAGVRKPLGRVDQGTARASGAVKIHIASVGTKPSFRASPRDAGLDSSAPPTGCLPRAASRATSNATARAAYPRRRHGSRVSMLMSQSDSVTDPA